MAFTPVPAHPAMKFAFGSKTHPASIGTVQFANTECRLTGRLYRMADQRWIGMLRVKNEATWLERVLASISPLCARVYVLDDHSTDRTPEIIRSNPNCAYLLSPFTGLDETRDKNWLLGKIILDTARKDIGAGSPWWVLLIDGDEELEPGGDELIRQYTRAEKLAYSFQVMFLWDREDQVRVDGVYKHFCRPSMFRLISQTLQFTNTSHGGNLHCSSTPREFFGRAGEHGRLVHTEGKEGEYTNSELLPPAAFRATRLLHYGYMRKEDRVRKFRWYNRVDPGNKVEDEYRHMIQGDGTVETGIGIYDVPRDAKLRWAGPLKLETLT